MSKTEARQHFGAVHIYWHPPDHCWDASPTQRRQITHSVQRTLHKIDQVQQQAEQPKGQDLMSMASDDEAVRPLRVQTTLEVDRHASTPWVERWVDIETSPLVARWVDIAPVAPPPINERKPEPMVRPLDLVLLLFAIGLSVGTMNGQNRRPHSRTRHIAVIDDNARDGLGDPGDGTHTGIVLDAERIDAARGVVTTV